MPRHPPRSALSLIGISKTATVILQMRAEDRTYRDIARVTKIAPRKVRDQEIAAMRKIIRYMEQQSFLGRP